MLVVSTWKKRANGTASIAASLLRACKTVHAEARGILYSQPIQFGVLYDMVAWLQSIGPENRLYLRNVHIGSKKGFKASHLYGQAFSRKVARLLADAPNLQTLEIRAMHIPDIKWHRHMDQNGQIGQKWLIAAQHIAQLIYDEFRPVFSKALSRGKTPQQLRTFVKAHKNLFLGPSDKANYFAADVLALQLTPSELTGAEAEVAEHFKFLLERNLYYRRHPRYTQTPEIV
ncbi:hypothetical protein CSUB01_08333 [Colletotrichum sublineola]|uniref:Uncharacterized protein n=1 Tax=Colletotrichum sublineola TaxID=1173701 RepID=A0A066XP83_COLSU|nr:hypothetical protein CSUB01_08333 [Colletotrichum sublineola]